MRAATREFSEFAMQLSAVSERLVLWMLKTKALQNLAAAELLLVRGLRDPAVSRLYYAAFQAAVVRLTERGVRPEAIRSGAVRWDHSMVINNARLLRGRRADRKMLDALRSLRVCADYLDASVNPSEIEQLCPFVVELVGELTS